MEWRTATVERIMALQPRRVLEIGAGSGLVLSQIAPHLRTLCRHRHIGGGHRRPRPLTGSSCSFRGVIGSESLTQPAHVTEALPQGYFDTIILNSVIQYFPNDGISCRTHRQSRDLLPPGGTPFIGDVRNYTLQGAFRTGVALARTDTEDTAEIRQRVQRAMLSEAELLVAPRVFHCLGRRPTVGGRPRYPSQTRLGRQRTEPVPLRRRRPQRTQHRYARWRAAPTWTWSRCQG